MIPETLAALKVPIDSLRPYAANPRNGDTDAIVRSLRRNGQYRPIVVRTGGEILAGNHTYMAAMELGWSEIAATFVDVDDEAAARIVLVDNRSNDLAGYNDGDLVALLESLPDLEGTGFEKDDLDALLAKITELPDAGRDTEPGEVPAEPRTVLGDLYALGDHRLLCGDSLAATDVNRLMSGTLAQLVFTDPPYGVAYEGGRGNRVARVPLAGDKWDIYGAALGSVLMAAEEKAALYLWFAGSRGGSAFSAVERAGYDVRALLIWNKLSPHYGAWMAQYMPRMEPCIYAHRHGHAPYWYGATNEVNVWDVMQPAKNEHHPTQKPVELAERAITNSSQPGDIVLDLFGGSGSTLIAAHNLKRHAYLMELDPGYCDVIVDRWERHTGKKAERITDGDAVEAHA